MAYGRLEVYWPDGQLDTYILNTDTVSVGRADGNTVALDTETISRYHFSIVKQDEVVTITDLDSANGTFVDGIRLESNQAHELGDVEEIQVGALRIIYFKTDDEPTLAMQPTEDATQRIERDEAHVRLDLDYARLNVWPAASSSAELSVTNIGTQTRQYTLHASGVPTEWLRINYTELELNPGETAYVLINIKPPRRPTTTPMHHDLIIEVAPVDQPELAIHALIDVTINPYSGFGMALVPQMDAGDPVSVFLHNQGSGVLTLKVSASDPNKTLSFRLPDAPVTLQAGQRLRVDIDVRSKNPPLLGSITTQPFLVQVQAQDASSFIAATQGTVKIAPRFPMWLVLSVAGIVLSAFIIAVLALMGVLSSSEPLISSMSVNASSLQQGQPLLVYVEATDVEEYDLLVNQHVIEEGIPAEEETITLETSELSGMVTITLIGRNGSKTTTASVEAEITIPVTIQSFSAEPDTLVRYVVGTLELEWDVRGAQSVRIEGLGAFTNQLLQPSTEYAPVDELEGISGIPLEPLEISLYAEGLSGEVIQDTLHIQLIDPQCDAQEDLILYEGPSDLFQQVGRIPSGGTVTVTAQDSEAGWLRVQLPGEVRGWGAREAFICADTFNLMDLRTEMNPPPLPTSTDLPTVAPSATPPPTPAEATEEATPERG